MLGSRKIAYMGQSTPQQLRSAGSAASPICWEQVLMPFKPQCVEQIKTNLLHVAVGKGVQRQSNHSLLGKSRGP